MSDFIAKNSWGVESVENTGYASLFRVYAYVTKEQYYNFINMAVKKGIRCDANGRIDVGALINDLVAGFGEGYLCLNNSEKDYSNYFGA